MGAGVWHSGRPSPDGPREVGTCAERASRVVLASVMTPSTALQFCPVWPSLIQLSVQDAPELQGRRKKIAKWDQRGRKAHTLCTEQHQAAT